MKKYDLLDIFNYAKEHSPYYRELYKNIVVQKVEDIPIVDQASFWKNEILTGKPEGIVFKSGGSTGNPKYSYFTHDEWDAYTESFGIGLSRNILKIGDKMANLFYGGDLYASFFFIKDSIRFADPKLKLVHFPIAGQTDFKSILKSLNEFKINVLCGIPSSLVLLLKEYEAHKSDYPHIQIDRILYGGEGAYEDQRKFFTSLFPKIEMASIGCASVDGGMIGYSSPDCLESEHRVFEEGVVIEIIDEETLLPIREKGKIGKVLLTNLTRKLMPIIRYPSGDMAMWLEDEAPNRKLKLCGRSDEAARLGTLSVYFENTRDIILGLFPNNKGMLFQMISEHFNLKDQLSLCIYTDEKIDEKKYSDMILESFKKDKKTYEELLSQNLIHPLKVIIAPTLKVQRNERTGKLKRIIDIKS